MRWTVAVAALRVAGWLALPAGSAHDLGVDVAATRRLQRLSACVDNADFPCRWLVQSGGNCSVSLEKQIHTMQQVGALGGTSDISTQLERLMQEQTELNRSSSLRGVCCDSCASLSPSSASRGPTAVCSGATCCGDGRCDSGHESAESCAIDCNEVRKKPRSMLGCDGVEQGMDFMLSAKDILRCSPIASGGLW